MIQNEKKRSLLVAPLRTGFVAILWTMLLGSNVDAQLAYHKLVGVGVDSSGRPWVSGTWDTGSDGVPDRIQMTRYTTSGIENLGFDPLSTSSEVALNIYGGGGVDLSTSGAQDQPWLIFDRDTEPDSTRNDFASRRYNMAGVDTLGYGLDVANPQIGSILRSAGVLQTNILGNPVAPNHQLVLSILDSGANAGKVQISRFNDLGNEAFGGVVNFGASDDLVPATVSGIGAGNQSGSSISSSQNLLFMVGTNNSGIEQIKAYSLDTYTEFSGWALDLPGTGPQHRFMSASGVGVDPVIGQPWIVGPFDSDGDGDRDNFTTRRYDPSTGFDNLGFGLSSTNGTIVNVEGIGIDPVSRDPWFAVLLDTNSDSFGDRWGIQRYTFNTGVNVVDQLISANFMTDLPTTNNGDTDNDGDVDNVDLANGFAFFTGPLPAAYVRNASHGDTDGDTDVDNTDLATIISNFTGPTVNLSAALGATLIYDPATGEAAIDPSGSPSGAVVNFTLQTSDQFNATAAELPVGGPFVTATSTEMSATDATLAGLLTDSTGTANLGTILPAGMNLEELDTFLTTRSYVPGLGYGGATLNLSVVPEPSSCLLACFASLLGWLRRSTKRTPAYALASWSASRCRSSSFSTSMRHSSTRTNGLAFVLLPMFGMLFAAPNANAMITGLDTLLDPADSTTTTTNITGPPSTARDTTVAPENTVAWATPTAEARKLATPYQSIVGNWITTQNPGASLSTIGSLVQTRYDTVITPLMATPTTNSITITDDEELIYPTGYFNNASPVSVNSRRFVMNGADGRTLVGYYLNYDKVDPNNKSVLLQVNGHFGSNPSRQAIGLQNQGGLTGAAVGKLAMQGIPIITYDDHNVGESSAGTDSLARTLENLEMLDRDVLTEFNRVDTLGLSGGTQRLYHYANFFQSNVKSAYYSGWNVPGWAPYDAVNDPGGSPYGVNLDTYLGTFHENFQYSDLILNGISKGIETTFAHNAFEGGFSKYGYHVEVAPTVSQYTSDFFNLGSDPDGDGVPDQLPGFSHEYHLEDVQKFLQWSRSNAALRYDPLTGNVEIDQTDAAGNVINNFILQNDLGGSDFNTGVVNFPYSGILTTDTATEISQSDPLQGGLPTDAHNLGNIFPTGMNQSALEAFLTRNSYVGELGSGERELALISLSADFNEDGMVDGADFLSLQRNLGKTVGATRADGDSDLDFDVDADDLARWAAQYGSSFTVLAGAAAVIPEPGSATLLLLGLASCTIRRRKPR